MGQLCRWTRPDGEWVGWDEVLAGIGSQGRIAGWGNMPFLLTVASCEAVLALFLFKVTGCVYCCLLLVIKWPLLRGTEESRSWENSCVCEN